MVTSPKFQRTSWTAWRTQQNPVTRAESLQKALTREIHSGIVVPRLLQNPQNYQHAMPACKSSRDSETPNCECCRLPEALRVDQTRIPDGHRIRHGVKEDYTVVLTFDVVFPLGLFLLFGITMPVICPCQRCILEVENLFNFPVSQLEGNLHQNESWLESHPYLI